MLILPPGLSQQAPKEPPWWQGKQRRFTAGGVSLAVAFATVFLPMIPTWLTIIGIATGLLVITVPFAAEGWGQFWSANNHVWPAQRHAIAVGLVASTAILVGTAAAVSAYLVTKPSKPEYQQQLKRFYDDGTALVELTRDDVERMGIEAFQLRYYNWAYDARHWVAYNMSEAAAERLFQPTRGLTVGIPNALNVEHSRITSRILDFRQNLLVLMEDPRWQ